MHRQPDADMGATFIEDESGAVIGTSPHAVKPRTAPFPWKFSGESLVLGRTSDWRYVRVTYSPQDRAFRVACRDRQEQVRLDRTPRLDDAIGMAEKWWGTP